MTDDELLAHAGRYGYAVVEDGGVWRVVDAARAWQPAMTDRALLLSALRGRLVHVRADPNQVPWTPERA